MTEKSSVYQKLFSELIEAFTSGEIDKKGYEECLAELGKVEKDFQASLTRPIKSQTYKELLAELDELYEKKEVNKDEHVRGLKMLEATEKLFKTIFPDNKIPDQVHDFLKEKFPLKKEAVCMPTKAEVYIANHENLLRSVGEILDTLRDMKSSVSHKEMRRHLNIATENFETAYARLELAKECI